MAVGDSGRVVIDLDPKKKRAIYAALKKSGRTMREWFLTKAEAELISTRGSARMRKPATGQRGGDKS